MAASCVSFPDMEAKDQLLETWHINARLNLYLLDAIPEDQLAIKLEKGKTVEGQFTHIHNVRLMWLKASAPDLREPLEKLERTGIGKAGLVQHLDASTAAIAALIDRGWENGGKVKNFKPHVTAFVGYFIAHETFHRTSAEIALRQAGVPLSDKTVLGIWEWGSR